MGRIKDLVIELQNEYGFDLENMPNGFAMDEYLEMKSKEENTLSIIVGNPPFPNKLVLPKVHLVVGNPPFSNSDEEKPLSIIVGNPPFPNKLVLPKVHLVVDNPPFSNSDELFCQTINIK